jgi:O-antigen/teichoic acid export membrane protein
MTNDSPYSIAHLRNSIWYFLTGKVVSAVMTFFILLWVVRLLTLEEYGVYITLVAGMELVIAISGLGLPWLAARYLPEYRLHASGSLIQRLAWGLLLWMTIFLSIFVGLLEIAMFYNLFSWTNFNASREVTVLYLIVLLVEGIRRFIIIGLLEPLMQQHIVRASLVVRQFMFISILFLFTTEGTAQLIDVVRVELFASFFGMVVSFIGLWRYLSKLTGSPGKADWREHDLVEMCRTGFKMYIAQLFTLLYSPQIFQILLISSIGSGAAAVFGFLRTLYDQVARYLPATLFIGLIRPKLITSFIDGGGMVALFRNVNLAGKLSFFVLMPLVALSAQTGELMVELLSGGRFSESGLLFFGFMLVLIPFSQRQLIESIAVTSGHAGLCVWAAASGLILLPLMWIMLQMELGLWAGITVMGLGHFLFNIIVVKGVSKLIAYRSDWLGFVKLLISALVAYGVGLLLSLISAVNGNFSWLLIVFQCGSVMAAYFTFAWWIKPFSKDERERINTLIKYPVFVW